MGEAAAFSPVADLPAPPVEAPEEIEDAADEREEDPFQGETPALQVEPGPRAAPERQDHSACRTPACQWRGGRRREGTGRRTQRQRAEGDIVVLWNWGLGEG